MLFFSDGTSLFRVLISELAATYTYWPNFSYSHALLMILKLLLSKLLTEFSPCTGHIFLSFKDNCFLS